MAARIEVAALPTYTRAVSLEVFSQNLSVPDPSLSCHVGWAHWDTLAGRHCAPVCSDRATPAPRITPQAPHIVLIGSLFPVFGNFSCSICFFSHYFLEFSLNVINIYHMTLKTFFGQSFQNVYFQMELNSRLLYPTTN